MKLDCVRKPAGFLGAFLLGLSLASSPASAVDLENFKSNMDYWDFKSTSQGKSLRIIDFGQDFILADEYSTHLLTHGRSTYVFCEQKLGYAKKQFMIENAKHIFGYIEKVGTVAGAPEIRKIAADWLSLSWQNGQIQMNFNGTSEKSRLAGGSVVLEIKDNAVCPDDAIAKVIKATEGAPPPTPKAAESAPPPRAAAQPAPTMAPTMAAPITANMAGSGMEASGMAGPAATGAAGTPAPKPTPPAPR